jgi:hypothetical protein
VAHLAAVALISWGLDRTFVAQVPEAVRPWAAGGSAVLVVLGLSSFWSLLRGYGRGDASRSQLLRRASTGEPPAEDGPILATGRTRPLSAALRAPISGTECLAYVYRMYRHVEERGDFGRRRVVPVYWGQASRPFRVDTDGRAVRVLAVPQLADDARPCSAPDDVERARQHVAATRFEDVAGGLAGAVGTALQMAGDVFGDEDGESRRDWRKAGDRPEPGALLLEETVLPVGARVTVAGRWSAERQAIVPASGGSTPGVVTVVTGGPERLASSHALPSPAWSVAVAATLLTAAGAGIVWLALTGRLAALVAGLEGPR